MMASSGGLGSTVASHYNNLKEAGKEGRKDSRIFHMRNLNNWIKSQLVNEYMDKVKSSQQDRNSSPITVLDIGCGKGGDLLKWSKARVGHVVCADIAATSVEQARERYNKMGNRGGNHFSAEFIAADCTKTRLLDLYKNKNIKFDIVSCQFAFHYCFESLPQAEMMLQNITECLKPGGYFIGTTPDAYDIVQRIRKGGPDSTRAGNEVYSVSVDDPAMVSAIHAKGDAAPSERIPLFGARYNFHLEGVVDCPEFLVHFPTLDRLAEKFGLMLIAKRRFGNYFNEHRDKNLQLLQRMNGLESYPPRPGSQPVGPSDNYAHADAALADLGERAFVGTLSKDEWEAATLYVIFAFKKRAGE